MDLFKIFSISGSGMAAQKSRMSVVAGNLANSESTRTVDGGPYRRRDVIFQAAPPPGEFADELNDIAADQERAQGVEVVGVKQSNRPPRRIFDPSHPDASQRGLCRDAGYQFNRRNGRHAFSRALLRSQSVGIQQHQSLDSKNPGSRPDPVIAKSLFKEQSSP